MRHYALLGEALGHSLSVPIHTALLHALGVSADYRLVEVPKPQLAAELPRLMTALDGFNITIPYKQAVMPALQSLDATAKAIGAVNTVICADRSGYNTDAFGFQSMLQDAGIDPQHQPCFVLGTGGASKAVVHTLQSMGAAEVVCVSRRPGASAISYDELAQRGAGLLVNTTPVGMFPQEEACPLGASVWRAILPRLTAVADVIYRPKETVLLRRAKAEGLQTANGLRMLVAQAAEAERLWQQRPIPMEWIDDLCKELEA